LEGRLGPRGVKIKIKSETRATDAPRGGVRSDALEGSAGFLPAPKPARSLAGGRLWQASQLAAPGILPGAEARRGSGKKSYGLRGLGGRINQKYGSDD